MFQNAGPEKYFARTLIMSYALKNVSQIRPLTIDAPIDENNVNFQAWRLSKANMELVKSYALKWVTSCNFDTNGWTLQTDSLHVRFSKFDILENDNALGQCTSAVKMIIRGETCQNCNVAITQSATNPFRVNTDSPSINDCGGTIPTASTTGCPEESFGLYQCANAAHQCAASPQSTTQFWIE